MLFTPIKINRMELRNRIVMSAMHFLPRPSAQNSPVRRRGNSAFRKSSKCSGIMPWLLDA